MQEIRRFVGGAWYVCRPAANGRYYIYWSEGRRSCREGTRQKELAAASAYFDEWLRLREAAPTASLTCADLFALKYGDGRGHFAWAHLASTFGTLRPAEVTQTMIDEHIARRRKVAAASTVRFEVSCLFASWNAAVKAKKLPADALPALDPPPPPSPPRDRWLRDAEIDKLMEAARGNARVERFLWIALDACARRTAICELRWDQIDWDAADGAGVIHFLPEGRAQTRKRRVSVVMSRRLRAVLWAAYAARKNEWVLDHPGKINHPLTRVAARAKVAGVTPHVLRHTAATHMARRGVSLWIIAKILGITVEVAEKVYAKYQPGFGREAVESIGGSWGRPKAVGAE